VDGRRFIEVPIGDGDVLVWCRGPVERSTHGVLLLHDRLSNAKAWDLVMSRMPRGVSVIAPDLRGRGSAWRLPVSAGVASHLRDLETLLDRLDLDHVIAVGHGFGAVLAGEFARTRADRAVMSVGILGDAAIDPFEGVLGIGFPDRIEHQRYWHEHPSLAASGASASIDEFVAHGIAGPTEHHRWRVDLRSLIADDASVLNVEPASFTRSIIVGSTLEGIADLELTSESMGTVAHLPGVEPSIVLLTDVGADAVVAQVRPLLEPG
jgi:pimeloyl-ACP methyl ester carboxylesterase